MHRIRHAPARSLLVATLLAWTSVAGAGIAVAADVRTDATGDNGGIGPDIVSITVDVVDDELVVAAEFATDPPLAWSEEDEYTDTLTVIGSIGPEAPPAAVLEGAGGSFTGFSFGVHAVNIDAPPPFTPIVDGQAGEVEFGVSSVEVEAKIVTLRVPLEAIDDPNEVHLFVWAGREGPPMAMDTYPDDGWASYSVAALGRDRGNLIPTVAAVAAVAVAATVVLFVRSRRGRLARLQAPSAIP